MTTSPDTFQSLVASLAACGGELLRQLAVEHESEVKRLRCEIDLLQAHIGASPDFKLKIREEAEKSSQKIISPVTHSPLTAKERQRMPREGKKKRDGKPDENALAKAFAFVDSHIGDSINDDRAFMSSIPEHAAEDTARVLEVAAEIVDYVQQSRDSTREPDSRVSSRRIGSGDAREICPARGPPRRENANVLPPAESAGSRYFDFHQSMLPDNSGQIGIKLSSISPPVKAPDRMTDPPYIPEDEEMPAAIPDIYIENEVLNERLNSGPSSRVHGSPATAAFASSPAGEFGPGHLPVRSVWNQDDSLAAEQSSASSYYLTAEQSSASSYSGAMRPEDLPLTTPRLPTHEDEEKLNLFGPGVAPTKPVPVDAESKPETARGTSPPPSRETTTFPDQFEDAERQSSFTLRRDGEASAASELLAEGVSKRVEEPAEDWRSLLQVHGAKWRPDGDDGVGIGMYLETPAAPSGAKATRQQDFLLTPTSI